MGNALRFLYGHCCKPTTGGGSASPGGHHALSASAVGVNALAEDLRHFDITSQVPEGLSKHVNSSKKAQAKWYRKLVAAWREAKRPPTTAEEAARLVLLTLKGHQKQDVEGLLAFYSLPAVPTTLPDQSVIFELQTLPVDRKAVADGDTLTVYVNTKDPQESECIPRQVKLDFQERSNERAKRNYNKADALHNNIINSGYRVLKSENGGEILARKYKIQLRGVDAPKYELPYGKEAKIELTKLVEGKCLRVLVYEEDCYGRYVADVYSNGVFVQKEMLRGGCAKHYIAFDKRPQLASWEKEAKAKRLGLWALPNMRS